jgi:guanylate kinase
MSPVNRRGLLFVVSGPSGVGKSSILRNALGHDPQLGFSVSHTTREPRSGERDGEHYHFVDTERFRELIDQDAFLEYAAYRGNLYGTTHAAVDELTQKGIDLILEVEVQGASQLRETLEAVFVFVLPPFSLSQLEARLRERGSDDEAVIRKRLQIAQQEIQSADMYDYVIVNDDLERAVEDFMVIVRGARLQRARVLPEWRSHFEAE